MELWVFGVSIPFEEGAFRVSVRDLPEVVTSGLTEVEALEQASDAIETSIGYRMKKGEELPSCSEPHDGEVSVTLPARMAAKASLYEAWRQAGISQSELARRMNREPIEVRRILDPWHGTKIDQMDEAARALGGRLMVGFALA